MTKDEFLQATQSERIRLDAFSLGTECSECYVLIHHLDQWNVYYAERGIEAGKRWFFSESAALEPLLDQLRSDPSTRY